MTLTDSSRIGKFSGMSTEVADHNHHNSTMLQRALTMLALLAQEQEQAEAFGVVGIEVEFRRGRIESLRRSITATEK